MPLLPQGFLDKLLDKHDGLSKELLKNAVFYVVRRLFSITLPISASSYWNRCVPWS